jgi:hypothetical protein
MFVATAITTASAIINSQKPKNYWQWMDENCQKLSLNEYDNLSWSSKMSVTNLRKAFI